MPILKWDKVNNLIISYINNTLGIDEKDQTGNKAAQTLKSLVSFAVVASYINRFPNALLQGADQTYYVYDAGDSELKQAIKPPLQVVAKIKITPPKTGEIPQGETENGGYKVQFVQTGHDPIDLLYKDGIFTNSSGKIKLKPAWLKRKIIYKDLNTLTKNDASPESVITIFIGEYLNRGALGIPDQIKTAENSEKPDPNNPIITTKEKIATPDDAQWKTKVGFAFIGVLVTAASVMGWCLIRRYSCCKKLNRQFPRLRGSFFNNNDAERVPLDDESIEIDLDTEINTADSDATRLITAEAKKEAGLSSFIDTLKIKTGYNFIKRLITPTSQLLPEIEIFQEPTSLENHVDVLKNYIGSEAAKAFKVNYILYSTGKKIELSVKKSNTLILKANQQIISLEGMLAGTGSSSEIGNIITKYHDDIAEISNTNAEGFSIKEELIKIVSNFNNSGQSSNIFLAENKRIFSQLIDRASNYIVSSQTHIKEFNRSFQALNDAAIASSSSSSDYPDYKVLTLNISEEIIELENRIGDAQENLKEMAEDSIKD
ncbi:hypothetical protein ACPRNU_18885 [Chromobacterium vaccinii]|uniref:hypothetical protein n=1 Tax=Chromobacterium vaccinii TaxID=1108595 RepID=UPI003C742F2A